MLVEDSLDGAPLPPTINAVLSARLDRLGEDERALLQGAAVIGREFGWRAVADLCGGGDRGATGASLHALVRKGFLRPRPSATARGEMFEFAHILMRDVAYETIAKSARADHHERLADWLAGRSEDDGAEETLLGYHLEQAHRYLVELGTLDERAHRIAARGSAHLAGAGRRAYVRGDLAAAIELIDRALELSGTDSLRVELLPTLGDALCERGDLARAEQVLTQAIDLADARGDRGARHHAAVLRAYARSFAEGGHGVDELRRVAEEALAVFDELGDEAGLARAWQSIAIAHVSLCQWAEVELARRLELAHARRAGDQGMVLRAQ
jgi:predicted ATPase